MFTFAGIVGAAGLNEAGLAVNINYLSPTDVGLGRLHSVVVRQILAATSLADALTPPAVPPRGGADFLVADQDGNVVSLETTARRQRVFHPEGNALGHTNHYLSEWLKEVEHIRPGSIGSSLARHAALRRYLNDQGERLTLDALMELTREPHVLSTVDLRSRLAGRGGGARGRTVSAMVQVPAERTLHLTRGCACENDYHAVIL